jgi:hypothetical protein
VDHGAVEPARGSRSALRSPSPDPGGRRCRGAAAGPKAGVGRPRPRDLTGGSSLYYYELFLDPAIALPKVKIGWKLARRALGFRALLDVIPLDGSLVRGSHGRLTDRDEDGPVFLSSEPDLVPEGPVAATAVKELILDHVFARG